MHSVDFPSAQIELALNQSNRVAALEFSVYDSRDSAQNSRRVFVVKLQALRTWWDRMAGSLYRHEEIGLNSRIQLADGDELLHLPMVDLRGGDPSTLERVSMFIRAECPEIRAMNWFKSGRSFHGYGVGLLDERRWRYFMGTLLLFREEEATVSVDTRWVGHRLRDGYGCLRLTKNTAVYAEYPSPLGAPEGPRPSRPAIHF